MSSRRAVFLRLGLVVAGMIPVGGLVVQSGGWSDVDAVSLLPEEVDGLLDDLVRIEQSELFDGLGSARDCGPLLNPLLEGEAWWAEEAVIEAAQGWDADPYAMPAGDLSVLDGILACDHWDPWGDLSGEELAERFGPGHAFQLQDPAFMPLIALARLRLASALREELPPLQALAEVHHLGLLASTAGRPAADAVAAGLFLEEQKGAFALEYAGQMTSSDWEAVSPAMQARLRRVSFLRSAAYMGVAPEGSITRLEATGVHSFARCAALSEGLRMASLVQEPLSSPWPLEQDRRPWLAELEAALEEGGCRVPLGALYHAEPDRNGAFMESGAKLGGVLSTIPWYRQGPIASTLARLGGPMVDLGRRQR